MPRSCMQGVITNDMKLLATQTALHTGVLSPQGKILFELFVVKTPDGFCLETARDSAPGLVEHFQHYKLRAKADVEDASADYTVAAIWGGPYEPHGDGKQPIWFADPRLPDMGYRELVTIGSDWALAGEYAPTARRRTTITRIALRSACPRPARTTRSATPIRTRRCSISSTASPSRRAASSARRSWRACSTAARRASASCRSSRTARCRRRARRCVAGSVEIGRLGSVDGGQGARASAPRSRRRDAARRARRCTPARCRCASRCPPGRSFSLDAKRQPSGYARDEPPSAAMNSSAARGRASPTLTTSATTTQEWGVPLDAR